MKFGLKDNVYIGDSYCFNVVEALDSFVVSICSTEEYYEKENPEFALVDMLSKEKGWTREKVEILLEDDKFLLDAVKIYMDMILTSRRSRSVNLEFRERQIVDEVKQAVEAASATCWTLEEASSYSKIGINRLRKESLKKGCPWVLWVGDTKRLVKVESFKKWLDEMPFVD